MKLKTHKVAESQSKEQRGEKLKVTIGEEIFISKEQRPKVAFHLQEAIRTTITVSVQFDFSNFSFIIQTEQTNNTVYKFF